MNAVLDYFNKAHAAFRATNKESYGGFVLAPPIVCADGFEISVQASAGHYCAPRNSQGPWTEVECGFPSEDVPTLSAHKDGDDEDTKSVFGWTPIELVNELIASHGGIKE